MRGQGVDPIAELERRLAQLEARPSGDRVVLVQQAASAADKRDVPESENQPSDPADEAKLLAQKQAAATDALEARLLRETPDPAFNGEATRAAREGVETGGGSRVASVECVSSMCKVVTTHDTLEDQSSIGTKIEKVPFFGEGTYFSYERDVTPPRTTLYVVRPGHSFRE
jgi:hypothetical protein